MSRSLDSRASLLKVKCRRGVAWMLRVFASRACVEKFIYTALKRGIELVGVANHDVKGRVRVGI